MRPRENEAPGRCSGEGAEVLPEANYATRIPDPQAGAQRTRQPAYGRQIWRWRAAGFSPTTDLLISVGWDHGKRWAWRIVIAEDMDPAAIDFRCCAGLSCLLVGDNSPRMDDVARAVVRYGPLRLIGVCLKPRSVVTVYLPSGLAEGST